jgi:two-component system CheB/CheR fusion protein
MFQDVGKASVPAEPGTAGKEGERDRAVAELESELLSTRERLQVTIEELETANEEMKASNEEFQSVNEELQSSNEELETSKEELQSLNEELETVNTELSAKVESLERANNDRKNLLESTQIATLFLDNRLCIKSFTPAVSDVFHLIDGDIGRPITDIASRLGYGKLEADIRRVMRTLERAEQEVALTDGSAAYVMRILPYRTLENVIDGVVITFLDITERKRSEEALARLATIVTTSHEAIIGLTEDATITAWNAGAERMYGHTAAAAIGRKLSLLIPPDRPGELQAIVERIKHVRAVSPIETVRQTKDGRRLIIASTVSPIRNPADKLIAASAIERDITELKHAEEQQKVLIAELNHRVKNTLASVISISASTMQGRSSLEGFRAAFEGRIRALANAHDLLSRSGWSGADLRDIVATELEPYSDQHRLSIRGNRIVLAASAALTFSMIVHELATNAAKYGALSANGGAVQVDWSSEGGRFVLHWQERDGPKIATPERYGFGVRLIERSVANDLQGQATIAFEADGLRCKIDVPLREALARAE